MGILLFANPFHFLVVYKQDGVTAFKHYTRSDGACIQTAFRNLYGDDEALVALGCTRPSWLTFMPSERCKELWEVCAIRSAPVPGSTNTYVTLKRGDPSLPESITRGVYRNGESEPVMLLSYGMDFCRYAPEGDWVMVQSMDNDMCQLHRIGHGASSAHLQWRSQFAALNVTTHDTPYTCVLITATLDAHSQEELDEVTAAALTERRGGALRRRGQLWMRLTVHRVTQDGSAITTVQLTAMANKDTGGEAVLLVPVPRCATTTELPAGAYTLDPPSTVLPECAFVLGCVNRDGTQALSGLCVDADGQLECAWTVNTNPDWRIRQATIQYGRLVILVDGTDCVCEWHRLCGTPDDPQWEMVVMEPDGYSTFVPPTNYGIVRIHIATGECMFYSFL